MLVRFLTEQILYFLPQLQPKSTFLEKKSQLQKSTARALPGQLFFDISESTARAVPGQLILEDEKFFWTIFNFSLKNSLKMLFSSCKSLFFQT